jgi:hypothetical protein
VITDALQLSRNQHNGTNCARLINEQCSAGKQLDGLRFKCVAQYINGAITINDTLSLGRVTMREGPCGANDRAIVSLGKSQKLALKIGSFAAV